jgi:hypothetical protein
VSSFSLHDVAPRLAKARDQRREELRVASAQRRHLATLLLDAERRVAHRELQLVRSYATRNLKYIAHRQQKLKVAESQLEYARRQAAAIAVLIERKAA